MTTLTIPYTLEDDNGAIAPDYKPEAKFSMEWTLEAFYGCEAGDIADDEIKETLLISVRDHFECAVSPVVGEETLAALIKQVRAALVARDSVQALPNPA